MTSIAGSRSLDNGETDHSRADSPASLFRLDIRTIEDADTGGAVNVTNDNCGSTCGACVTGAL